MISASALSRRLVLWVGGGDDRDDNKKVLGLRPEIGLVSIREPE